MFYQYNQNNSGGRFIYDEKAGISVDVIIEADSEDEANRKAEDIGLYWHGVDKGYDCECCGDRWYPLPSDGSEEPQVYGKNPLTTTLDGALYSRKWIEDGYEGFIHYKDGRVVGFWKEQSS